MACNCKLAVKSFSPQIMLLDMQLQSNATISCWRWQLTFSTLLTSLARFINSLIDPSIDKLTETLFKNSIRVPAIVNLPSNYSPKVPTPSCNGQQQLAIVLLFILYILITDHGHQRFCLIISECCVWVSVEQSIVSAQCVPMVNLRKCWGVHLHRE